MNSRLCLAIGDHTVATANSGSTHIVGGRCAQQVAFARLRAVVIYVRKLNEICAEQARAAFSAASDDRSIYPTKKLEDVKHKKQTNGRTRRPKRYIKRARCRAGRSAG